MFSTFNHLNEGGCKDASQKCSKKGFQEGLNPKIPERDNQLRGWPSGKDLSHKNSHWEQLR
jgi:hypothetical protein